MLFLNHLESDYMKIEIDPQSDSMYIEFKDGNVHDTVEVAKNIFLDVNKKGDPLGLEVLFVSKKIKLQDLVSVTVNVDKNKKALAIA